MVPPVRARSQATFACSQRLPPRRGCRFGWQPGRRLPWAAVGALTRLGDAPAAIQSGIPAAGGYRWEGGQAMAWLRAHAAQGETILMPDDNRIYYLSLAQRALRLRERRAASRPSRKLKTPAEAFAAPARPGRVRYVLLTPLLGMGLGKPARSNMKTLIGAHPEAAVFLS